MITSIKAYAKINICLNVLDKLENGYHNVDLITIPLALHDIVELERLPKGYETFITSDDISIPTNESNLSCIAFKKLKEKYNFEDNFLIHIYKRIPMSAGLAGGSSNAAAVINVLRKKLKLPINEQELIDLGLSIGADVPFCIFNKPARCQGLGEKLTFINLKKKYYVLLIKPNQGISTAEAYKAFDDLEIKPNLCNVDKVIEALENGDDDLLAKEINNNLLPCAVEMVPEINSIIQKLKDDGFPLTMMSGSGSTVFALSTNYRLLSKELDLFDDDNHTVILTSTL